MLIKQLRLENIRSYADESFSFPEGSVLLAGDIGSGKSTLLLAIEFALFGLKLGELSGSALLRHGARSGRVEMAFEIDGKEYTISRQLKRGKDAISQDRGFITENGVQTDFMPKELRAKILELLNYPESVQGKSQDLIYRFTVYTPQEEMKRILYESPELRLDTLRKVFNIDKYKRVQDNAGIIAGHLREQSKELQGRIADLDEKKAQASKLAEQLHLLSEKEKQARGALDRLKLVTQTHKLELQKQETEMKQVQEAKKEHSVAQAKLQALIDRKRRTQLDLAQLAQDIAKLREETKDGVSPASLETTKREIEQVLQFAQKELTGALSAIAVCGAKRTQLESSVARLKAVNVCTFCLQNVPHEHKASVYEKTEKELALLQSEQKEADRRRRESEAQVTLLHQKQKEILDAFIKSKTGEQKRASITEKEQKLVKLNEEILNIEKETIALSSKNAALEAKLAGAESLEKAYLLRKQEHLAADQAERKQELEANSAMKEREAAQNQGKALAEEIKVKEQSKAELEKHAALRTWLSDTFIPLAAALERHVMLALHQEFNDCFKRWFGMLIEDENLSVKLDDTFSVVTEQDGYESSVENLSGGEKTSVALAYRLALNRVINDVMSTIRTKDLLILDEPTEGFSSEQLDKVREVLDELGAKQVIIVSHESKVESFVDHVIRISKQDSVSVVSN
ncbi:MAG: SMC family ATPase [Nanoarchaeota archaeon]|nr:SMC family ATPase [Nanoarchaeota archaeon]